jgi:hypothetical protein
VPPLSYRSSFVRLLQIRQPDNTMASTQGFALPNRARARYRSRSLPVEN